MNTASVNGGVIYSPDAMSSPELAPLNKLSGSLSNFNLIERLNENAELMQQLDKYCMHGITIPEVNVSGNDSTDPSSDFCQFKIGKQQIILKAEFWFLVVRLTLRACKPMIIVTTFEQFC